MSTPKRNGRRVHLSLSPATMSIIERHRNWRFQPDCEPPWSLELTTRTQSEIVDALIALADEVIVARCKRAAAPDSPPAPTIEEAAEEAARRG